MADKKQIVKTFSVKKTDNPVIEKFIKKQSNFSESIRYLIIKFCSENGVKDISSKLSEIMYNIDFEQKTNNDLFTIDNAPKSNSSKNNSEIVKDEKKEHRNSSHNNSELEGEKVKDNPEKNTEITVDENSKEDKEINEDKVGKDISNTNIDDDIPDCYM